MICMLSAAKLATLSVEGLVHSATVDLEVSGIGESTLSWDGMSSSGLPG